ncbi:hypothetical protein HDE_11625 [Halotydeus destructor]|nr:hypothetical protein HDE_11625 [Halotydeus destructor]
MPKRNQDRSHSADEPVSKQRTLIDFEREYRKLQQVYGKQQFPDVQVEIDMESKYFFEHPIENPKGETKTIEGSHRKSGEAKRLFMRNAVEYYETVEKPALSWDPEEPIASAVFVQEQVEQQPDVATESEDFMSVEKPVFLNSRKLVKQHYGKAQKASKGLLPFVEPTKSKIRGRDVWTFTEYINRKSGAKQKLTETNRESKDLCTVNWMAKALLIVQDYTNRFDTRYWINYSCEETDSETDEDSLEIDIRQAGALTISALELEAIGIDLDPVVEMEELSAEKIQEIENKNQEEPQKDTTEMVPEPAHLVPDKAAIDVPQLTNSLPETDMEDKVRIARYKLLSCKRLEFYQTAYLK